MHLLLLLLTLLLTMTLMASVVSARRTYRRRVGLLRSTSNHLPTDPWQLFNISITQTGNRTEGMHAVALASRFY